jgi:hypothetical protein
VHLRYSFEMEGLMARLLVSRQISKRAEALFLIFGFICLICSGAVKLDSFLAAG